MVHLSKLGCYSNIWLWARLNFADVLKMERYPLFSFFLFLGQKLTIVEQSCTLQGHCSLTSCGVLTAKSSNYLLSYSAFFWHILLYKYSTQYVSWNNSCLLWHNNCSHLGMINDYLQENTWCRMSHVRYKVTKNYSLWLKKGFL